MRYPIKLLSKAIICSIFAIPMLTSCFDDTLLWDKINNIENRLESLEISLNEQLSALNSLISGKTTIADCKRNADGSYDVELSNGIRFTVPAEGCDYSSLVSVKEVNGVKCWATYDANGNLVVLTDSSGNPIPVVRKEYKTSVEAIIEDGIYYLVIDGKKYMTGYDATELVQVFSSCQTHKDASGKVYAMTFTFGEGVKVTVAVDGYHGVVFKLPDAVGSSPVISEYYINYGETQSIQMNTVGILDYAMQVPDGWRIAERIDNLTGDIYLDITAPSKKAVESGAAEDEGDLKVVAVVEGGKAAITRLSLSATPFKVFNITSIKAEIEPYNGVQKYVYGLCTTDEYDETELISQIEKALESSDDLPAGMYISESRMEKTLNEIYNEELDVFAAYTFWAIPALYSETEGYYVRKGMFQTHSITPIKVEISEPAASLLDARVSVNVEGTESMYAGTSLKSDDLFESIIYKINNGIISPVSTGKYTGAASEFPTAESNKGVEFHPATTYVIWVVPTEKAKKKYSVDDIIFKEFTTKDVTTEGSLELTLGEPVTDKTSIRIPIASNGAEIIYYAYLSDTDGNRYSTLKDEDKAELIREHPTCTSVKASSTQAVITRVKPNTTMWLYAMAVDQDGRHGKVSTMSAKTAAMEYNDLTLSVTVPEVGSDRASFQVKVQGGTATEYIYWIGKISDAFWANTAYLGATLNTAQEYMACYPDDENIVRVMNKYGKVSADGTIIIDDLNMSTQYVFIVLAKDETGLYSKGGYKMITTLSAQLGTIVREDSAKWKTARNQIEISWIKEAFHKGANSNMPSSYAFNIKCPTDLTAYIYCTSRKYYDNETLFETVEDKIIDITAYAGRRYDLSIPTYDQNNNKVFQPDWTNDKGELQQGFLMNICDFYVHGVPSRGFATYLAYGTHGNIACEAWENGTCANYTRAVEKIRGYCTLEYWIEWFKSNKGMKNETYIIQNAQAYLDAYKPYYEGKTPILFENDGSALRVSEVNALGLNDAGEVVDDVVVVFKDNDGNYYEPMFFDVPNYFK